MALPEWLFGPSGDMRPLPAPATDVVNTVQRFGGIHNAINGARTVDVLGHRANYEFDLPYLNPEEYFRLEALYTETIPGPFKLIDPLRKNWFSREAALVRPADASGRGVTPGNSSIGDWVRVTNGPVDWNQRSIEWTGLTNAPANGGYLRFDKNYNFPRSVGVLTASAHVNPTEQISLYWHAWNYDSAGTQLASSIQSAQVIPANTWTRIVYTYPTPPAGTVTSAINLWYVPSSGALTTTKVLVMNPQLELGTTATAPAFGGGLVTAVIESMDATSPYYPYQSVALKILEV